MTDDVRPDVLTAADRNAVEDCRSMGSSRARDVLLPIIDRLTAPAAVRGQTNIDGTCVANGVNAPADAEVEALRALKRRLENVRYCEDAVSCESGQGDMALLDAYRRAVLGGAP